jgi:type IV pilus assembly protein PilC
VAGQRALIYDNLSVLLAAGLPILRSIPTSVSGMKGRVPAAFSALAKRISIDGGLAETMAQYPKAFSQMDVLVVEAGEISGNLSECLKLLSHWYAFCDRLRQLVISGMMLPCLLIHLAAIFAHAPALILGRISLNRYLFQMLQTLAYFYVPLVVIYAVVRLTPKTGFFRRLLDSLTLRIPVVGQAVKYLALSRYCRVFHMLFKGGVPVIQCAQKASEHTGNILITDMLAGGARSAIAGNPMSEGYSKQLPENFIRSWQIGEDTGELDNVVERLVENTTEISERLFAELAQWIPKLVYFLVSLYIIASIFRNIAMFG